MDLQRLKTFRTVATLMNFNQAARILHFAQSTVSAQIRTLEDEVGAPLFDRLGKKVLLTEAGEKMLGYAHKILAIEEEALAEIRGRSGAGGRINLRAPQTVAACHLPDVLADFLPRFPSVGFDLSQCAFTALVHEMAIGVVDLAFLLSDSIQAENLNVELLGVETLRVTAGAGHRLTGRKGASFPDLEGETLFLPKADCGYRMEFEQSLMSRKVTPGRIIDVNSLDAIKQFVARGLGVTVMPDVAVRDEIARGRMAALDWQEDMETGVLMIWAKGKWLSPILREFMDTARRVLGGR
ncbi:MAG: LysR family transcriptional regulator [Proteobacteria bacterium]|nr:LysR family transcriptional regulator [Pseudomonadota bacterium]